MSSNAQREIYPGPAEAQADLREMAAAKLAAHRSRRSTTEDPAPQDAFAAAQPPVSTAAQRVRDAVAARYRQTPSYREYLAEEAERAVKKAQAEVEIAARTAKAVAEVQTQLLAELQQWPQPDIQTPLQPEAPAIVESPPPAPVLQDVPLRVRTFESIPPAIAPPEPEAPPSWVAEAVEAYQAEELQDLNQEIAFRLDPEFHEHLLEPLPLQANIIEFPRQLVATKKARPRLAEGPLRTDEPAQATPALPEIPPTPQAPPCSQLRIFEVETEPAAQVVAVPETVTTVFDEPGLTEEDSPEWQRLILDARPEEDEAPSWVPAPVPELPARMKAILEAHKNPEPAARVEIYLAPLELRLMSAAVDGICLVAAFLLFAGVAAGIAGRELHEVPLRWLAGAAVLLFGMLFVLYQGLFFTLGKSTLGMYYADLVLKTPQGEDPTREALRRRVWANLLAAVPLGLGYLWAVLDSDNLGWQDRLSGTYLREY
jgi:hypothetical protein